jgi:sirohydrochlorin ferrochelatase
VAQTDQVLAGVRDRRRKGGRRIARLAPSAAEIAAAIREEFGEDSAVAGRVLAAAAPQIDHLAAQLRARGADMALVPSLVADLLGLAAEELCRPQKPAHREGGAS